MNATHSIMTVTVIGLLAVMSPGPDFLIVTRNSLLYSKRVGLCTALGITVGTMAWVLASLAGISLVISKTVLLFNAIKWLGALYLIYIGIQSLRSKKSAVHDQAEVDDEEKMKPIRRELKPSSGFWTGLKINLLNPKAALFFVSFFSVVITPETPMHLRFAYGFEVSLIALCWFSLVATVLSMESVKGNFLRLSHWIERATGAVLILLGVKLALYNRK